MVLKLNVESFDDVVNQGYKIITYGKGLQEFYLKTAPEGSSMRWVYENQVLGNKEAIVMNFDELLNRKLQLQRLKTSQKTKNIFHIGLSLL